MFNLSQYGERHHELIITDISDPDVWAWDVEKKDSVLRAIGADKDLLIVTGRGDNVDDGIDALYKNLKKVHFESGFCLQKHDWYDVSFSQNMLHRYAVLQELGLKESYPTPLGRRTSVAPSTEGYEAESKAMSGGQSQRESATAYA